MTPRRATLLGIGFAACVATEIAAAQTSANYTIRIATLDSGADVVTSASYKANASLGNALYGSSINSATYVLYPGLWFPALGGGAPPILVGALSRRVHGAAGVFDLLLSLVGSNPSTEPRQGPGQNLVFVFDKPIISANASVAAGTAVTGAVSFNGVEVTVPLTGVANQDYVTVSLTNVTAGDGGSGGTGSVRVGYLLADINGNRVVTLSDVGLVNAALAQSVTVTNFLRDVNTSGTLTLTDKSIANAQLTRSLPPP